MKKNAAGIGQIVIGDAKTKRDNTAIEAEKRKRNKVESATVRREAKILKRKLDRTPRPAPSCFNNGGNTDCGTRPQNTQNRCGLCHRRGRPF